MSRHRKKAQRTRPAAAPPVATIEGAFALVAKMPVDAQARYDEARGLASRGLCVEARRLYAELEAIAEAITDGVPGARQKNQGIALFLG
jgi:hypothetical protein